MSSLLDLGPLTEDVEIRGITLTIHGLTAADLFKLFAEYPDAQQLIGKFESPGAMMMSLAPDLFAKAIAAAVGAPGDQEMIAKARKLAVGDQVTIVAAVMRLSFPEGFGPFVERLTKIMGTVETGSASGGGQVNSSPVASSAELQTDSPGMTRGISPRVN